MTRSVTLSPAKGGPFGATQLSTSFQIGPSERYGSRFSYIPSSSKASWECETLENALDEPALLPGGVAEGPDA